MAKVIKDPHTFSTLPLIFPYFASVERQFEQFDGVARRGWRRENI